MRLIVTRPEPDAGRTAEALARLGHEVILSPALDIVAEPPALFSGGPFQAVLVTSINAVRMLAAHPERISLADTPLLAVGDRTALEAKRAGFGRARSAGGALPDLLALARSELRPRGGPLLYATGESRTGDLAAELQGAGFAVETAILYRSVPRPTLSEPAALALRRNAVDGILLFSARSAEAFAAALRNAGLSPLPATVACFAISSAAAAPIAEVAAGPIRIAARPDQISLFALIERGGNREGG